MTQDEVLKQWDSLQERVKTDKTLKGFIELLGLLDAVVGSSRFCDEHGKFQIPLKHAPCEDCLEHRLADFEQANGIKDE